MNFLAHFHQAYPDPELIIGGLQGDYLKGPLKGELPLGIERGVALHRAIDAFTDQHPVQQQCRQLFPQHLRRYSGVLLDLSFDHFLSLNWPQFSEIELAEFSREIYQILGTAEDQLCPSSNHMAKRLEDFDILSIYNRWDTVTKTAERIGERFKRGNPFMGIEAELSPLYPALEKAFIQFYPELCEFVAQIHFEENTAAIIRETL